MALIVTNSIEIVTGNKHNENVKKKLTTKGTWNPVNELGKEIRKSVRIETFR